MITYVLDAMVLSHCVQIDGGYNSEFLIFLHRTTTRLVGVVGYHVSLTIHIVH
jgi:hypothetical protein